jgi:hypothetical protein
LIFTAVFVIGLIAGLPINVPDGPSLHFAQYHYFAPLLIAFLFQLPVFWVASRKQDGDPFLLIRALPFVALVIFVHFNFKAWMPLVNGTSFDAVHQRVDESLWPVVAAFSWLRETIAGVLPFEVDRAYHSLFVGMFFVAFAAHAMTDTPLRQRQLVLGVCLILLVGGMMYWIAPALGPFLYREGLNEQSVQSQTYMLQMFHFLVSNHEIPPGYFAAPPAAMPSLHVAHALFFTLFAWESLRKLFWVFLPLLIWIILESVASGWHYVADLPVGAALALVTLRGVKWLTKDKGSRANEGGNVAEAEGEPIEGL